MTTKPGWLRKRAEEASQNTGMRSPSEFRIDNCECDYENVPCRNCVAATIEQVASEFAERAIKKWCMPNPPDDGQMKRALAAADVDEE
jgi:hypothetical protein